MLFGPKQLSALLVLNDVSESAKNNKSFQDAILYICGSSVKGQLGKDNDGLFALIKYADHSEVNGKWNKSKISKREECSSSVFQAMSKGTDPLQAIYRAIRLLDELGPDLEAVKPLVILLTQADEPIAFTANISDRNKFASSLIELKNKIDERGGSLVIISGPYEGLRRDLEGKINGTNIMYCNPSHLKECHLDRIAKDISAYSEWTYPFRKTAQSIYSFFNGYHI